MRAIIVDDEPKAIALLVGYLKYFKTIEVVATFRNGLKAFEFLNSEPVDLVFLDINMPHLSGVSLSRMIDPETRIIFTTAYSEYAVESYEVEAVDYLLKPISLERFTKAIGKVISSESSNKDDVSNRILIKSGTKIFRVDAQDILYLIKDGNYMVYHLPDQKIVARESVTTALSNLPQYFIQTHKSHVINIQKIDFISKNEISINEKMIPIGASFKENVLNRIR